MVRCLVTGGTGFIGSHLANHLTDDGHEVIVVGTKTERSPKAARHLGMPAWQAETPIFLHAVSAKSTFASTKRPTTTLSTTTGKK